MQRPGSPDHGTWEVGQTAAVVIIAMGMLINNALSKDLEKCGLEFVRPARSYPKNIQFSATPSSARSHDLIMPKGDTCQPIARNRPSYRLQRTARSIVLDVSRKAVPRVTEDGVAKRIHFPLRIPALILWRVV